MSKPASGFGWTQEKCGLVLRCSSLSKISSHFVTTRGCSVGGVTADRTWATIAKSIGISSERLIRVRQEHGREVVIIRRSRAHSAMWRIVSQFCYVIQIPERLVLCMLVGGVPPLALPVKWSVQCEMNFVLSLERLLRLLGQALVLAVMKSEKKSTGHLCPPVTHELP